MRCLGLRYFGAPENTLQMAAAYILILSIKTGKIRGNEAAKVDEGHHVHGAKESGWAARIVAHFPPGQFGAYMVVGILNTAFGYGSYALLTSLFMPRVRFGYILASVLSNFLAITFAFLNYKWFIFKTEANYLREWSRCVVVYGGTALVGTGLLGPLVFVIRYLTTADRSAPYIAGALVAGFTVLAGFLGHKNFSFAQSKSGASASLIDNRARGIQDRPRPD